MGGGGPGPPSTDASDLCHLLLPLGFGGLGVGVVVALDQHQVVGLRVDDKLPGSILQRKRHLVEDGPQLLQSQNSEKMRGQVMWSELANHTALLGFCAETKLKAKAQLSSIVVRHLQKGQKCGSATRHRPQRVGGDGHDAFRTLLRGKAGGVLQSFVGEGSQVKARLVGVTEPGAAGHGQNLQNHRRALGRANR